MNARARRLAPVLLVVLPGGSIAVAGVLLWRWRKRRRRVQDLIGTLNAGLPELGRLYVSELALAAVDSCPDEVPLERWAFAFSGIIARESMFGALLRPRGPNGLGDAGHGHGLGQVDDRSNPREPELSRKRLAHIASGEWTDPEKHLAFCARQVLRFYWDEFADIADAEERLHAAVAAYNAGEPAVRAALALGADPDSRTTGRDYSANVLARADSYNAAAIAAAPPPEGIA